MGAGICAMLAAAHAGAQTTPDAAFAAGKDFAAAGKNAAAGAVNAQTGQQNLPHFNTNAPESSSFMDGRGAVGGAGAQKQIDCQTYRAGSAFDQQDCDAVNFMTRNSGQRPKFKIDKKTDPLMTGSKRTLDNPGAVAGRSTQQCRIEHVKVPGKTTTETCTETQVIENPSCSKVLTVNVQMNCQPDSLFPALDMARNAVDHVKVFAKCDPKAVSNPYIEMTADAFGIRGGTVRNQLVKIPKNISDIPANAWVNTADGRKGYLLVTTRPHWEYAIRSVPVYILQDSKGCQPGSTDCAYHFYWEWTELMNQCDMNENCPLVPVVQAKNEGWATGVIGEVKITDSWDNQCLYLESRSR